MSRPYLKPLLLIVALLAVPVVPFLLFGNVLEPWVKSFLGESGSVFSFGQSVSLIIGLLIVDILLPIPSSAVCTFAGKEIGTVSGTLFSWIGLNLSAAIGYWIGSTFGLKLATKFSDQETLSTIESWSARSSMLCLVLCRGLPIVAEASVLMMGIKRLPMRVFWPAILLSNLGLAAAYCALGHFAQKAAWFPVAFSVSLAVPLLFLIYWKTRLSSISRSKT